MNKDIQLIKDKINTILKELLNSPEKDVEINELNSVQFIKLIVEIEMAYDFEFDDDDLVVGRFKNIDEFAEFIYKKTSSDRNE